MDLSGLKWPLIIVLVVGGGWLFTSGGVNWMQSQAMKNTPGVDENQDKLDEATLSRLGGYMLRMWRYDKAIELMEAACDRYPGGANFWYNVYRLHTCYERKGHLRRAVGNQEFEQFNGAVGGGSPRAAERQPESACEQTERDLRTWRNQLT